MADIREYIGNELSGVNVNLLERRIVKGFHVVFGDIVKIRSLYDYLLVQAETELGDNLTRSGGEPVYSQKDGGAITDGASQDKDSEYFMLVKGDEITGKFKSVKVLDGEALVIGRNFSSPKRDINFIQDFHHQPAFLDLGSGDPTIMGGIEAWYDASAVSTITIGTLINGDVSRWDSKAPMSADFFEQPSAGSRPQWSTVDLSVQGGSQLARAVKFHAAGTQYLIGAANATFSPQPNLDKFTVIMAVSGDANLLGTILDRTWWGGLSDNHQFQYSLNGTGGGTVGMYRNIGNAGDQNTTLNLANRFNIIVSSAGYDSESAIWAEHLHISHTEELDAFMYGVDVNLGIKTIMGASRSGSGSTIGFPLEGNIHEIILIKNRIAVSDYGDFNLNVPMIDAIGLYLKNKWVPDGGNVMWTPTQ